MALRDQPYFPLYVDDYLTDEKLNMCAPASQGIYIKILCIMHKSEHYGCILLKQKDKRVENVYLNFANKLARLLPFTVDEINTAIEDLIDEKVLYLDGDMLCQKRMIKDNSISVSRSKAGAKGGETTQKRIKKFAKPKDEANSVNVNEDENVNEDLDDNELIKESDFDIFWQLYKKGTNRVPAQRAWAEIENAEYTKIIEHVPKYVEATPEFRKDAVNYLKDRNWLDSELPNYTKEKPKPKPYKIRVDL